MTENLTAPGQPGLGDQDRPNAAFVFVFVLASVIVLLGVVLAVDQFFKVSLLEEIDAKVNSAENPALRQLRADEDARLSRYQWIDQKTGVLRIPVDRARERVLAEWGARPQGFVVPPPDPAPAAKPADMGSDQPAGKPAADQPAESGAKK